MSLEALQAATEAAQMRMRASIESSGCSPNAVIVATFEISEDRKYNYSIRTGGIPEAVLFLIAETLQALIVNEGIERVEQLIEVCPIWPIKK